ncbi:MAG: N-acetyltransferase family protein [Evtepia gabavorous]
MWAHRRHLRVRRAHPGPVHPTGAGHPGHHPYLCWRRRRDPAGLCYAAPFHPRAAYQWAAETTIYLRQDQRGRGLGRRLYGALEALLTAQNVLNCNACIALPQVEDETLTLASLRFHQRLGYTPAGQFHQCGYKFGRWYHMVWMEKFLGAHSLPPAPFLPFPQLGERTAGLLAPWATAAVW